MFHIFCTCLFLCSWILHVNAYSSSIENYEISLSVPKGQQSLYQRALLAQKEGKYQQSINLWNQILKGSGDSSFQSYIMLQLALDHYEDQDINKSVKIFIQSINNQNSNPEFKESLGEHKAYRLFLEQYLELQQALKQDDWLGFIRDIKQALKRNPSYDSLRYFLAIDQANNGNMRLFYKNLYRAHEKYPNKYIGFRSLGMLNIMMWQRSSYKEKEPYRLVALENLEKAISINPKEGRLYRILFSLLDDSQESIAIVKGYLELVLEHKIKIPRTDLFPIIKLSVSYKAFNLAQDMIDLQKTYYKYSKGLSEGIKYLEDQKTL